MPKRGSPQQSARKLILKCGLSPGDIIMLTAAVRDLHTCYPRRFLTDVRTCCPELWEHNRYLTPISDTDPNAEAIDCSYPLINRCNTTPYHCLHGFIEFLNERLGLAIRPTAFKGDIHLSPQEKAWYSQVRELTGKDIPFWIVVAGGKYDVTIKWWEPRRYQQVIDYFRGKIQFVQAGEWGHHHPRLEGVVDLRGKTGLRQLIRLVYHSQGVLCPVTAVMHLAAAVEFKRNRNENRPCVVIAGGREPAHWEAYPEHQFIHTNGALPCCQTGGCWKDRAVPLRDGDLRDKPERLCVDVVDGLPHCLSLITPEEVIRRIELYFEGGRLRTLSKRQVALAEKAVRKTQHNPFDRQPLNLHSAGLACDAFIQSLPQCSEHFEGRGIVICAGGRRYLPCAWVCINMLRRLGCQLPVELWHLDKQELPARMRQRLVALGVECVDASKKRRRFPARILNGWELKAYALLHSRFKQALLLDADNVPVVNPQFLFETPEFRDRGALFWPDYGYTNGKRNRTVWRSCGLPLPREREFETGQIVVDKARCWRALRLAMWFSEQSDFYYTLIHGDKETFHLAFRKLGQPYHLVPTPIHTIDSTMCQHDFAGRRIFQHRNMAKWTLDAPNKRITGFWFESECLEFLEQIRKPLKSSTFRVRTGPEACLLQDRRPLAQPG